MSGFALRDKLMLAMRHAMLGASLRIRGPYRCGEAHRQALTEMLRMNLADRLRRPDVGQGSACPSTVSPACLGTSPFVAPGHNVNSSRHQYVALWESDFAEVGFLLANPVLWREIAL